MKTTFTVAFARRPGLRDGPGRPPQALHQQVVTTQARPAFTPPGRHRRPQPEVFGLVRSRRPHIEPQSPGAIWSDSAGAGRRSGAGRRLGTLDGMSVPWSACSNAFHLPKKVYEVGIDGSESLHLDPTFFDHSP